MQNLKLLFGFFTNRTGEANGAWLVLINPLSKFSVK
jgi:hypothetical protein